MWRGKAKEAEVGGGGGKLVGRPLTVLGKGRLLKLIYFGSNSNSVFNFDFRYLSILVSINLGILKLNFSGIGMPVSVQVGLDIDLDFRVWSIFFKFVSNFV